MACSVVRSAAGEGPRATCGALVVGFGPAGVGVFTAAIATGRFGDLLESGTYAVDAGESLGAGTLGRYAIGSDSHAESFLAAVADPDSPLAAVLDSAAARQLEERRGGPVPLHLAARFQAELARAVAALGVASGRTLVHTGWRATGAVRDGPGWTVELAPTGPDRTGRRVRAQTLVLATGAVQSATDLAHVQVAGTRPWHRGRPTLGSDVVVRHGGDRIVRAALTGTSSPPRVVVVGASHSALASVAVLLAMPDMHWADGAVTILHNQPMRPMYQTPAAARAEGFVDFGPEDLCPRTGRVLPLAGFRSASRELLCSIRGLGARPVESRVRLRDLRTEAPEPVRRLLDDADLVILATGYRPLALPLLDEAGAALALSGVHGPGRLVDSSSRVLDIGGRPVPGLFATGLNSGYPLAGRYGEPSFTGQANGLALWQTDIGAQIAAAVLDGAAPHGAERPVHSVA